MSSISKSKIREIADLHEKLKGLAKKSAQMIFEVGRLLVEAKQTLDHGQFEEWVEQNLPFTTRTARRYIKVFYRFKTDTVSDLDGENRPMLEDGTEVVNDPEASLLDDMSIAEAYVIAGVNKLSTPTVEREPVYKAGSSTAHLDKIQAQFAKVFKKPALGGQVLANHRVMIVNGELLIARKDREEPYRIGYIYTLGTEPNEVYEAFVHRLQVAVEMYCSDIEKLELERSIEAPPAHLSLLKNRRGADPDALKLSNDTMIEIQKDLGIRNKDGSRKPAAERPDYTGEGKV